jgi:hypothetical protein
MSLLNDVLRELDKRHALLSNAALTDVAAPVLPPSGQASGARLRVPLAIILGITSGYFLSQVTWQLPDWRIASLLSRAPQPETAGSPAVAAEQALVPSAPAAVSGEPSQVAASEAVAAASSAALAPNAAALSPNEALINLAYEYLAADKLMYPPGQNAFHLFRQVLLSQPEQPQALAGIEAVKARYQVLFDGALAQGDATRAARFLERMQFAGVPAAQWQDNKSRLQAYVDASTSALAADSAESAEFVPEAMAPAGQAAEPQAQHQAPAAFADEVNPADLQGQLDGQSQAEDSIQAQSPAEPVSLRQPQQALANLRGAPQAASVQDEEQQLVTAFHAGLLADPEAALLGFINTQAAGPKAQQALADWYVRQGNTQALQALLQQMPQLLPWQKDRQLARLLLRQKNYTQAAALLERWPEVQDPELLRLRALSLQQTQRPAQAAQLYRTLLSSAPRDASLWLALGAALDAAGQPAEAAPALAQAQQLGGHSPAVQSYLQQRLAQPSARP